ncbi:hypothetical protein D7D82_07020 [Escherichia coli]|nr:hypothetical protein [Escherichia coli]EFN8794191.1 hypothetical protein [Escherichia coli]TXR43298.1 hypothetical protein FV438_15515 [Escherichia coli]
MSWINCWREKTRKSSANCRPDKAFCRIWQSARSYIVTGLINVLTEILPHKLTSKLSPVHCIYIITFELFYF